MPFKRPELLSPAGSLDKLKTAIRYGADAVYLAGQKYGLRSAAENFTLDELEEGVGFARDHGAKVYVVLNSFPHQSDMEGLGAFARDIAALRVDGVIASDMGVISVVSSVVSSETTLPIHLSTQASCLNRESALLWKKLGVKRLILGREVSIEEAGKIKVATGLEVELFIHGSMCMAYSGNCTISNFTKGRDSNRGGCAQSCRFSYSLETPDGQKLSNRYLMSSKDLMGLNLLPRFFEQQIDSVKIEGRMRSALYAGLISRIHRQAIDSVERERTLTEQQLQEWHQELELLPHRDYMSGSLDTPADQGSTLDQGTFDDEAHYEFVGWIRKIEIDRYLLVEVKTTFKRDEMIELVPFRGPVLPFRVETLASSLGEPLEQARVNSLVRLPYRAEAAVGNLMRQLGK
ncbi:U32 family peptidase C-terminal domain-containing protein [Bdellovibrionota bacterium FG-1]